MDELVNVAQLDHEVEANALGALLDGRGIPHQLRSYYDAVYNGVFQLQRGWGCVLAPETQGEAVRQLLATLRAQADAHVATDE